MSDVFNNQSNNYIIPSLAPCESISDNYLFEFLPKEYVGVSNGSNIVTSLSLGDIQQIISDYTTEKKIVQSGEVVYIPGLTKGLIKRTQVFDASVFYQGTTDKYFLEVDLSINYYKNFKYTTLDIDTSSNYSNNLDIDDALNISFSNNSVAINTTFNSSTFEFQSTLNGWDFDISNVIVTLIDASLDSNSPFPALIDAYGNRVPQIFNLNEDISAGCLAAKYINGAMQGIVLKVTYPNDDTISCNDEWIYINHVPNTIDIYNQVTINSSIYYDKINKKVDVGLNGPDTSTVISAGGYLDLITTNNQWSKIGKLYAKLNAADLYDYDSNLINGFYIFNPQSFDIAADYIIVK